MADYNRTDLFGGAIVVDLPNGYIDVRIRQVPDNQEVYVDNTGFSSISFDLTERSESITTDDAALQLQLEDILDLRDGVKIWNQKTVCLPHFPKQTPTYALLVTTHPAPNPRQQQSTTPEFTALLITLIRLEAQKTDVVVTINVPHIRGSNYNEEKGNVDLEQGRLGLLLDAAVAHQDRIHTSLEVKDWGLFV
ncbi:MAG: multicopy suppressor of ts gsp1 [Geoglossum simile]|nr:MAG: multicopy suppressor of ts gsp1 [Geoglossum simile]